MNFSIRNKTLIPLGQETTDWLFDNEGETVQLEQILEDRTQKQNRYLWKVFQLVADDYNETHGTQITKEQAKARLLYKVGHADYYINTEDGQQYGIIKDTRDLSKKDFADLTDRILKHLAEHGIYVLSPEEYFIENAYK